jgi:hypothetical protein
MMMNQAFIVKNSFLEEVDDSVVMPPKTLTRSMSDSCLYHFDDSALDDEDEQSDFQDDKRSESTASTCDVQRKPSSFLWSDEDVDDLDEADFSGTFGSVSGDEKAPASPPGVHFVNQPPPGVHQVPFQAPAVCQPPPGVHSLWVAPESPVKRSGPPGCWTQPDGRVRSFTEGCIESGDVPASATARKRSLSEGCDVAKPEEDQTEEADAASVPEQQN